MHPSTVVYLEHDGKVLLVDSSGHGPQQPVKGRVEADCMLRFPTKMKWTHWGLNTRKRTSCAYGTTIHVTSSRPIRTWHGRRIGHGKTLVHPTTPFIPSCRTPFTGPFIGSCPKLWWSTMLARS